MHDQNLAPIVRVRSMPRDYFSNCDFGLREIVIHGIRIRYEITIFFVGLRATKMMLQVARQKKGRRQIIWRRLLQCTCDFKVTHLSLTLSELSVHASGLG